ncbi:BAH-domain-containing protein [Martensiomyces pterosporus]|nr:BAH-domain-containing protein [Martensiomyces pterosporus]
MSKQLALPNSDSSLPTPPASITISGGTVIAVDDYVYLLPEYPEEPYYIGRVMEFVYVPRVRQPKPLLSMTSHQKSAADGQLHQKKEESASSAPSAQLRARLAWFQRPRDLPVTRVRAKDMRLLVATMHSDLNPVSAIKGKCFVKHTCEIPDLNAWKAKPDHYYYAQLFDRYSTRLYDIIPVSQIRNAPQEVLQKLHDTYQFIFAEPQKISDLVNTRRACIVCAKWCSINESLKCSICEKHYHMQCLDPPLSRKPTKGYSWQCAACLRRIQEQRVKASEEQPAVSDVGDRKRSTRNSSADDFAISLRSSSATAAVTSSSAAHPAAAAAAAATASDTESRSGSKRIKLSHGDSKLYSDGSATPVHRPKNRGLWPFRYFGINTNIDDVLHDDERIYPRAVSRIGPKYQAIVPDMVSPSGSELDKELAQKHAGLQSTAEGQEKEEGGEGAAAGATHALRESTSSSREAATGAGGRSGGSHGSGANGSHHYAHRGKDSGGGRWHTKNAEQLDRMWDEIELQRGNRNEQVFFKQPDFLPDEELDMYFKAIVPFLRRHFESVQDLTLLDCQDAALHGLALHGYDVEEALISIPDCPESYIRQRDPGDNWEPGSVEKFDECMREYGSNLQSIHNAMPENTRRAITLHYYLVRPTERGKHLLEAYDNRNHAGLRRPNLGQGESAVNVHHEIASDAGVSNANTPASSPRSTGMVTRDHTGKYSDPSERTLPRCLNCQRDRASRWFPAPLELTVYNTRSSKGSATRRLICGECRDYWLHYATMPDQEAINARKHSTAHPSSSSNGVSGGGVRHQQSKGDESRRSSSRARHTPTLQRPKVSELWAHSPCNVCKLATNTAEQHSLMCHDCGVCVHVGCAGYPESAKIDNKRWRCGVCANINNPTISINYTCILCRKDAPPSDRPRQLMWRTSGNNWVHALCALSVHETSLLFVNNNVVVNGIPTIPEEAWLRRCSTCTGSDGAVLQCAVEGCIEGAHTPCAHIADSESDSTAARAVLVSRPRDDSISVPDILQDISAFVANGGKLDIVMKCAKHMDMDIEQDIDLGAVNHLGWSAMSAVVATKMISTPHARGAMLHASLIKSQSSRLPAISTSSSSSSRSEGKAARDDLQSRMVPWRSPQDDPVCVRCAADFSPIWWPMSPSPGGSSSAASLKSSDVHVLCQRCYTAGATGGGQPSNVAST